MVCAIRFGKLKKTWAVIWGDAMFLLLVCSGDLDTHVLCGGCSSTIVCFCICTRFPPMWFVSMVSTQDSLRIYFTNATLNFHTTSVLRIWRHQVTIFYHNNIEQFLIQWFRLIAMVNKSTHHENDMMALAQLFSFLLPMHFIFQETSMEASNILISVQKLFLLWLLYQTLYRILILAVTVERDQTKNWTYTKAYLEVLLLAQHPQLPWNGS